MKACAVNWPAMRLKCCVPMPRPAKRCQVGLDVLADGRHDQRVPAQQLQVVADVARGAAELAPHLRRQEADVEDVQLVGEQVVLEAIRKHHDGVVGDRAGDEYFFHG